ncbi:MAG: NAD(+)/NADH kinase [Opitutaceae bacterium]|nr:NAD(+)/NADH kinase [Opitutaceae bacterium]
MPAIRRLCIVVNESKPGAVALAQELLRVCASAGVHATLLTAFPVPAGAFHGADACCVIGGDGTLLGVVHEAAAAQVPVIGVNRGSLGFLTTFASAEFESRFREILAGRFRVDLRTLLECSTQHGGGFALNDVLIKHDLPSKIAHVAVHADGELVTDYFCDGLILSTPTGSTAYNLSAGGPIVHPASRVIALTPICPHTLSNRTVIFPDTVRLRIENCSRESCLRIAVDGHSNQIVCASGPIEISLANTRLPLAVPVDYQHFGVVRTKLKWSGDIRERPERF